MDEMGFQGSFVAMSVYCSEASMGRSLSANLTCQNVLESKKEGLKMMAIRISFARRIVKGFCRFGVGDW